MRRKCVIVAVSAVACLATAAMAGPVLVEPSGFADGTDISNAFAGVTLSAVGSGSSIVSLQSSAVFARLTTAFPRAGNSSDIVFGNDGLLFDDAQWFSPQRDLRADFDSPTDFVSIDIWSNDNFGPARARIYDSGGILLDTFITDGTLGTGVVEVASFTRGSADIAYMTVASTATSAGQSFLLDSMVFNIVTIPLPGGALMALAGIGLINIRRRRGDSLVG